jgi:predicted ribosome quality control (RQC) complex YloA/Tae2 family protein
LPFDNYVAGAIARELHSRLASGKIERIYQPERDELLLHINVPPSETRGREPYNLLLSSAGNHPLLYLTETRSGHPQNPPGFCMLLRKHLLNGRIAAVFQVPGERIVSIEVDATDELGAAKKRTLVIEIMGKHSNIILLDPEATVPGKDIPAEEADFEVRSGEVSDMIQAMNTGHDGSLPIVRGESVSTGHGSSLSDAADPMPDYPTIPAGKILDSIKHVSVDMSRQRQMLPGMRYQLPPPAKGVSPIMAEEFEQGKDRAHYDALASGGRYEPLIYLDQTGKMRDFHVFRLAVYGGMETLPFDTVSAMLETWYSEKESGNRFQQKSADLTQIVGTRLDKLYLKKQRLLEDLKKAEGSEKYRIRGELITSNIYQLAKGMKEAVLTDYTADPPAEVKITLDPMLTPAQNAQKLFKRYSKSKTALIEKQNQLDIAEEEIAFLESYRVYIDHAAADDEIDELREELTDLGYVKRKKRNGRSKRSSRPAFLTFETSRGDILYVGRNNRENDELTLKKAKPNDLWLHTKDIPGSHVILTAKEAATGSKSKADPEETFDAASIREAAAIAAFYSKGRESANVPVDYTLVRYVKKPAGAKPGRVIFTHNKTIFIDPLKK